MARPSPRPLPTPDSSPVTASATVGILRDPRLVKEAVSFVAFGSSRRDTADEVVPEQVSLERYLFDRDLRWELPESVRLDGDR